MCPSPTEKICVNEGLFNIKSRRKYLPIEVLELENNYFEAIDGDKPVHPYIDLDGYYEEDDDEGEFNDICEDMNIVLRDTFPDLPIMCRNHFKALVEKKGKSNEYRHKFSYRITDHTKLCKNTTECKYYCEEVFGKQIAECLGEYWKYFKSIDTGVYGTTTQLMSCMNSYKSINQKDRKWQLINGEIKHTIIQSVTHGNEEIVKIDIPNTFNKEVFKPKSDIPLKKKVTKTEVHNKVAEPIYDTNDKVVKLLLNYMKNPDNVDYKDFVNVGLVLKNNDYSFELWYEWGQLSEMYKNENTRFDMEIKWEQLHSRHYPIEVLYKICKNRNPEKWIEYTKKYLNCNYCIDLDTLKKGDIFIGNHILPYIRDICKYSQKRFMEYSDKSGLWIEVDNIRYLIGTTINKCIDGGIQKITKYLEENDLTAEEQKKKREEITSLTGQYSKICRLLGSIEKYCKTILLDNTFYSKLDCNTHIFAFKNGIYDLETGNMRDIIPSDMLTKKLPFDYKKPTKEETDYVMEQLLKICNVDKIHRDYYLSVLSQALTGKSLKQIYYIVGQTGDNGKSTILDVLSRIFPCYVHKSDSELVEKGGNDKHKFIAGLKGSRIVYIEELDQKRLDAKFLKNITGGDEFEYKVMYGTQDKMKTTFTMFMTSNFTPNITTCGGMKNRNKLITFDSRFPVEQEEDDWDSKIFKQDRFLKDNLSGKYKNAFVQLIIDYAYMYYQEGLKPTPQEVTDDTDNLNELNVDTLAEWLLDNLEYSGDYKISKEMVMKWYEMTHPKKIDSKRIIDKVKTLFGVKYDKNLRFGRDNKKGGWKDLKFRQSTLENVNVEKDALLGKVWLYTMD